MEGLFLKSVAHLFFSSQSQFLPEKRSILPFEDPMFLANKNGQQIEENRKRGNHDY